MLKVGAFDHAGGPNQVVFPSPLRNGVSANSHNNTSHLLISNNATSNSKTSHSPTAKWSTVDVADLSPVARRGYDEAFPGKDSSHRRPVGRKLDLELGPIVEEADEGNNM